MVDQSKTPEALEPPIIKKPYEKPVLVRLGTMRDLTLKVGWRGQPDGGRFPGGFRTAY